VPRAEDRAKPTDRRCGDSLELVEIPCVRGVARSRKTSCCSYASTSPLKPGTVALKKRLNG